MPLATPAASLDTLLPQLSSSNPLVRCEAAIQCAALGEQALDAAPELIDLLDDHGWLMLDETPRPSSLPTTPSAEARKALLAIGPPVVPLLAEALGQAAPSAKWRIAEILGRLGDERATLPLLAALADTNRVVRIGAAQALARLGPGVVGPATDMMADAADAVRDQLIWVLGEVGGPQALDALVDIMRSEPPPPNLRAADALAKIGSPAVDALLAVLDEPGSGDPQRLAAETLGKVRDPRAATSLILAAFRHPSGDIRRAAVTALGALGDPRAAVALWVKTYTADPVEGDAAVAALKTLGEPAAATLVSLLKSAPGDLKQDLVATLVKIGEPAATPLTTALLDPLTAPQDRRAAAVGLKMLSRLPPGPEGQIAYLAALEDWPLLAAYGRAALPRLMAALTDPRPAARAGAASALGVIRDSESAPALAAVLGDADPDVADSAEAALARIGRPAIGALLPLLDAGDIAVAQRAARTLLDAGYRPKDARAKAGILLAELDWEALLELEYPILSTLIDALASAPLPTRWRIAWQVQQLVEAGYAAPAEAMAGYAGAAALLFGAAGDRLHALEAAGATAPAEHLLVPLLDGDTHLRDAAARAMASRRPPPLEFLLAGFANRHPLIRERAGQVLAEIGATAADPLFPLLSSSEVALAQSAAALLKQIGCTPTSATQRVLCRMMLQAPGAPADLGPGAAALLEPFLRYPEESVRMAAAAALGEMPALEAAPALVAVFRDASPQVKKAAFSALVALGPEAVQPLRAALIEGDVVTCLWVSHVLQKLGFTPAAGDEQLLDLAARRDWATLMEQHSDAVAFFTRVTQEDSANRRIRAAIALAALTSPHRQGRPGLPLFTGSAVEGLTNANPAVRAYAAAGFAASPERAANPEVLPLLLALLGDKTQVLWLGSDAGAVMAARSPGEIAALTLARVGPPAVDGLLRALENPHPQVRADAVLAAAQIADPRLLDALLRALADERHEVRQHAVFTLGRLGNPQAVYPLLALAVTRGTFLQTVARDAIVTIGGAAVDPLAQALGLPDENAAAAAASLLGRIRDPRAVPGLLVASRSNSRLVRSSAIQALAAIGDPQSVPRLAEALGDPQTIVRQSASAGVIAAGRDAAAAPLIDTLRTGNERARRLALHALEQITGQAFGDSPAKWEAWWQGQADEPSKRLP